MAPPLSDATRRGVTLLVTAAALAVVFRAVAVFLPARLDVALAAGTLVVAVAALTGCGVVKLPPRVWQLAVPAALIVGAMLWRDTPVLFALDVLAFGSVVLLFAPWARAPRLARAGVTDYLVAGAATGLSMAAGPLPLALRDVRWSELGGGGGSGLARRVALGLAGATPFLVVFGSLFRSADPAYDRMLAGLVTVDLEPYAEHGIVVLAWSWILAGVLWLAFRSPLPRRLLPRSGRAGGVELITALGVLLALFVSFMGFQLNYLFGGADAVRAMGLTYSEYARRGFFELVAVAALVVPLLLAADWALAPDDARGRRRLRRLEAAMVAVVFVLLASALDRMRLYTSMYGLTEQRLYTTAFMGWLALVLGWFVATVLRGRRPRFAWGAVVSGWLVLAGLHVVNPDALIVTTNARHTPLFDAEYAAELSADALPALLALVEEMAPAEACFVAQTAIAPLAEQAAAGGRWTLGLVEARRALARSSYRTCGA